MMKSICFENELDLEHLDFLGDLVARDLYVEELMKLAEKGENIVIALSDNSGKGKLLEFRKAYGDRIVDVGIAEPNEVGIAAGLALSGKIVFAQFFGPFLSLRSLDQVHTDIAYNELPVRLVDTHGGLTSGGGPTHYNIMDIAVMRNIPNMTVVVPGDPNQSIKVVNASINYPGPMFIRIARGADLSVYTTQDYPFEIGKAVLTKEGTDITVIATGSGLAMAVSAANGMEKEGVSVRVLDMHTIKPLDKEAILNAAKETGKIITVEDHLVVGGLGSAVAETLADAGMGIPFKRLGIPDAGFPSLGDRFELYAHYGYDHNGIKAAIREMMK